MKDIYERILDKAIPFYAKGREGDVQHVNWLYKVIPEYVDESEIDFDILIPVALLHDVGYSRMPKGFDTFDLKIRKLHSEKGAEIAEEILTELNYPKEKIHEIKRLILKHDDWAFGDDFEDESVLRIFNNFDFIWSVSREGFDVFRGFTGKSPKEAYGEILYWEKKEKEDGHKWFNKKIEQLFRKLLKERKEEIFA